MTLLIGSIRDILVGKSINAVIRPNMWLANWSDEASWGKTCFFRSISPAPPIWNVNSKLCTLVQLNMSYNLCREVQNLSSPRDINKKLGVGLQKCAPLPFEILIENFSYQYCNQFALICERGLAKWTFFNLFKFLSLLTEKNLLFSLFFEKNCAVFHPPPPLEIELKPWQTGSYMRILYSFFISLGK